MNSCNLSAGKTSYNTSWQTAAPGCFFCAQRRRSMKNTHPKRAGPWFCLVALAVAVACAFVDNNIAC
jgi:hypothetical protein